MRYWGSLASRRRGAIFQPGRALRSALVALALAALLPMSALAADPIEDTSTFGTGIAVDPIAPDNSSVPPAYLKEKNRQLKDFVKTGAHPPRPVKHGAAAPQLDVLPMSGTGVPAQAYLTWYPGFHQKTGYYCLIATVQSIAYFDLEPLWYRTLGSGSIRGAQDKLYYGYYDPDGTWNPALWVGGATNSGASDAKAVVWINRQFSSYGYGWYYAVARRPSSTEELMTYIRFDVGVSAEPTYIRGDLSVPEYPWRQAAVKVNGKWVHALHATLAVGYRDSDGVVRSYDPFTSPKSDGRCQKGPFQGPDFACSWNMLADNYYDAVDKNVANPIWW